MTPATVLITGANRGIGLALTRACLDLGHSVIGTARNLEKARELRELSQNFPERLTLRPLEVTSDQSVQKLAAEVSQIDVLINNAAIFPGEDQDTLSDWKMNFLSVAFETNVVGVARVTQALAPLLRKSLAPRVVNISSSVGLISRKSSGDRYAYAVSKAALNMLTRLLCFELHDMIVVAIHPGWVQTDMGGMAATLTPKESAAAIAGMLSGLTPSDSGCFLQRDGSRESQDW